MTAPRASVATPKPLWQGWATTGAGTHSKKQVRGKLWRTQHPTMTPFAVLMRASLLCSSATVGGHGPPGREAVCGKAGAILWYATACGPPALPWAGARQRMQPSVHARHAAGAGRYCLGGNETVRLAPAVPAACCLVLAGVMVQSNALTVATRAGPRQAAARHHRVRAAAARTAHCSPLTPWPWPW